jgi:hypothetical protein
MDCSFAQKASRSSLERRIENLNNRFKGNPFFLYREASQWIIKYNDYSDFSGYLTTSKANDLLFDMMSLVDLIRNDTIKVEK